MVIGALKLELGSVLGADASGNRRGALGEHALPPLTPPHSSFRPRPFRKRLPIVHHRLLNVVAGWEVVPGMHDARDCVRGDAYLRYA